MSNTWVIATQPSIASLLEWGRGRGGDTIIVAVGDAVAEVGGANRVIRVHVDGGTPLRLMGARHVADGGQEGGGVHGRQRGGALAGHAASGPAPRRWWCMGPPQT